MVENITSCVIYEGRFFFCWIFNNRFNFFAEINLNIYEKSIDFIIITGRYGFSGNVIKSGFFFCLRAVCLHCVFCGKNHSGFLKYEEIENL